MKVNLNAKNIEVFNKVPKKYRELIINTILTRSFKNGLLIKELSFFLSSSELEEIFENMNIEDIVLLKRPKYYSKNKKQVAIKKEIEENLTKSSEVDSLFEGFD